MIDIVKEDIDQDLDLIEDAEDRILIAHHDLEADQRENIKDIEMSYFFI